MEDAGVTDATRSELFLLLNDVIQIQQRFMKGEENPLRRRIYLQVTSSLSSKLDFGEIAQAACKSTSRAHSSSSCTWIRRDCASCFYGAFRKRKESLFLSLEYEIAHPLFIASKSL